MPDKPAWTTDQIVAQLINWGDAWNNAQPIAYSFFEQPAAYQGSPPGFSAFSFAQRQSLLRTMELISDVANLEFVNLPDNGLKPGVGNERIGLFNLNSGNTPFWGALTDFTVEERASGFDRIQGAEIVVNQFRASVQGGWGLGDSNSRKLMHELLHALGLDHPGPYNGDQANYETQALFQQDSVQYTVMSYWAAAQTGADHEIGGTFRFAATPLLYDVASLQALYGANMATRTGDTVYGYNSNAGRAAFDLAVTPFSIFTIWDAGGRDTLDLSGFQTGSIIDLAEGGFSSGGGMSDRISIAFGAVIENGVAGPGDDVLAGNAADNLLFLHLGGIDQAAGLDGDDGFYFGGFYDGLDRADGGAGVDTLALQGRYASLLLGETPGIEVLLLLPGDDARFGPVAGDPTLYAIVTTDANVAADAILTVQATDLRAGGEWLRFDGSAETDGHFRIFAGADVDQLAGGQGSDGFFFGDDFNLTGADRIDGGAGIDSLALRGNHVGARTVLFEEDSFEAIEVLVLLSGHSNEYGGFISAEGFDYALTMADGNVGAGQRLEIVAGRLGAGETIHFDGRAESDGSYRIIAGAGDDVLMLGAGADSLFGGLGADRLFGGGGADSYLYRAAAESSAAAFDTLVGFDPGSDRIDLPADIAGLAATLTASLSLETLGSDLESALAGILGAGEAVWVSAVAGDLAGRFFLVADGNGVAGWQAGADFLIETLEPAAPFAAGMDFFV